MADCTKPTNPQRPPLPPGKEDSKTTAGQYQSDKDWLRRGGRNDTIKR